jgi:flagellar biosynthesis/type III secretory pathway protein FliH
VAVKQVRVSDLSGRQAGEEQFAKLIVHEHPQHQGPITLDVLPEELGGLPHRGRISPEEATYVREHLGEVQKLRSERGVPLLDPADRRTKERYGL